MIDRNYPIEKTPGRPDMEETMGASGDIACRDELDPQHAHLEYVINEMAKSAWGRHNVAPHRQWENLPMTTRIKWRHFMRDGLEALTAIDFAVVPKEEECWFELPLGGLRTHWLTGKIIIDGFRSAGMSITAHDDKLVGVRMSPEMVFMPGGTDDG